jgi:DNA-binding beta-propeller fold protein YncE
MKMKTRPYCLTSAARFFVLRKLHGNLKSAIRIGISGILLIAAAGLAAMAMQPPKLPWVAPLIPTGSWPVHIVVDQGTNTAYIANQLDNTISVVDGRKCNGKNSSKCTPIATINPGPNPTDLVLDVAHRTLFASLAGGNSDSIAVIDIGSCNATNTSGCGQTPKQVVFPGNANWSGGAATVPSGFPAIMDLDETTHTLYVPDTNEGPVYLLNTATCNGSTPSCSSPIVTAVMGDGVVVERAHHSVYVVQAINFSDQVQIFDSSTCNSTNQTGCSTPPAQSFTAGFFPNVPATVDEATHTLYMPAAFPNVLGVIDTSVCNATTTVGCGSAAQVPVGAYGFAAVFDPLTKTVYVENNLSTSVSVVNGATCNAMNHSGCNQKPPILATGHAPAPFGYNPVTQTLYVSAQDTDFAWVLDGSKCNATRTDGCTKQAPTTNTGSGPSGLDLNPQTKTLYVANQSGNTVSVIDAAVCNEQQLGGCNQTWPTVGIGTNTFRVAINKATNTVYVANFNGTLSVINGATCNASVHTSCNQAPATTTVGARPNDLVVDELSNTIYVANRNSNTVSIVDGRHCQGSDTSGCSQAWFTFTVGQAPQALAFNPNNQTLYVGIDTGAYVSVVSALHCNNHDTADCSAKANVPVHDTPIAIGVLRDKNTIYVANRFGMSVSIFDGSICNASNVAGCPTSMAPSVSIAAFPATLGNPFVGLITGRQIAIDQNKHTVFIPTLGDTDLVVLDGDHCRADQLNGCKPKISSPRTGGTPNFAVVDPSTGTVYVSNLEESTLSLAKDKY